VPVFQISAVARTGLEPLLNQIWQALDDLQTEQLEDETFHSSLEPIDLNATAPIPLNI
jgi:hypothetical protein